MGNTSDFIIQLLAQLDTSSANKEYEKLKEQLTSNPVIQKFTIDTTMSKQAIKDMASEIHNVLGKAFKSTGIEDFNISVKDVESILSSAVKESSKISKELENATSKAQKFLSQFNNKSGGTLINSKEFKEVQNAINGLGKTHTIDDLNKSMNTLETTYNNMVSNLRNGGKSLNPFINAVNDMKNMDSTLKRIDLDFQSLSSKPKEVANSIKDLYTQQKKVNQYSQGTIEWSQEYGILQSKIVQVKNEIQNISKAEKASNTAESNRVSYYQRIIDNNKIIYSLKNKLLKSDKEETIEINRQIKALEERNRYNHNQLSKKGLVDNSWEQSVNSSKNALENQLRINTARQSDIVNAREIARAEKEAVNAAKERQFITSQASKIQLSMGDGTYESKVDALVAKTNQWTDANGNARISTNELSKAFDQLTTASNNYAKSPTEAHQKALIVSEKELDKQIKTVTNSVKSMNAELAKDSAISSFRNQVTDFMSKNGKTVKSFQFGSELKDIFAKIQQGAKLSNQELSVLKQRFIDVQNAARATGKLGKTWFQTLREGMSSFSYWTSSTFLVMKVIQSVKSGFSTVKELDTALVDLKKTTTMTNSELDDFYYSSNKVAKQMGVTTEEIINQAAEFSRLGYSSKEAATEMAKYSSWFKTISPGMSIEQAGDTLTSIMKAFKYDVQDVEKIMSMINTVGNNFAVSNLDISEILTRSSSAMMEANNSLSDTIALGTAATEITRDAASVGNALKTISMRIRGK